MEDSGAALDAMSSDGANPGAFCYSVMATDEKDTIVLEGKEPMLTTLSESAGPRGHSWVGTRLGVSTLSDVPTFEFVEIPGYIGSQLGARILGEPVEASEWSGG